MPGRIIQTLRRAESRNPVIMLDELDKVGSDFPRGDPGPAALLVFSTRRRNAYTTDHYLDLPFDLLTRCFSSPPRTGCEPIHPALRDRLALIEPLPAPSRKIADRWALSGAAPDP